MYSQQPDSLFLARLPQWVTTGHRDSVENVAFLSSAALTVLNALIGDPSEIVPSRLLANHLALKAAHATSRLEGRLADEATIRDAFYLTPQGASSGPDGEMLGFWRSAVAIRLTKKNWVTELAEVTGADPLEMLTAGSDGKPSPFTACQKILQTVLSQDPHAERVACVLSDISLARALGWQHPLPLTARYLTKPKIRAVAAGGDDADLIFATALLRSIEEAVHLARDLAERAESLRAITPKLRSKGSEAATRLFLIDDAIAPSGMLSPLIKGSSQRMTDRAARRFCDRLVELGVARELTGRPTFRLYGIAG